MTFNINEQFECVKPQGKPGERCGRQCIWFNVDGNVFIVCKFFSLKKEYSVYKK